MQKPNRKNPVIRLDRSGRGSWIIAVPVLAAASVACSCGPSVSPASRPAKEPLPKRAEVAAAIDNAVVWLDEHQVRYPGLPGVYPGDWKHHLSVKPKKGIRITTRNGNPFVATFVHHALAHLNEAQQHDLGIDDETRQRSRRVRLRAIKMMRRYEEPADSFAAGVYGYWPRAKEPPEGLAKFISRRMVRYLQRPVSAGILAPGGASFHPPEYWIWPDADCTSAVYVALKEHADLDGGAMPVLPVRHFVRWRDTPAAIPKRHRASITKPKKWGGAFLTWFTNEDAHHPVDANFQANTDIVVNANVLFALAQFGHRSTPGFTEALEWILEAIREERFRPKGTESLYYADCLIFPYAVTRAFREGPVPELQPAMVPIVRELESIAERGDHREVFWRSEDVVLSTACGALALMNAGYEGEILDGAISFFLSNQNRRGNWVGRWATFAETHRGAKISRRSDAWTTALALEALCRYQGRKSVSR